VRFILKRDRDARFRFAPLQSPAGKGYLDSLQLDPQYDRSIILIENDRFFVRSTAILRIMKQLGGPWKALYALIIIPAPIRDFFYNALARHRYRIFGRYDACPLPDPEWKERFL
jgi:predicted DCC family thiol-disulfide oxidoreductase YuxK